MKWLKSRSIKQLVILTAFLAFILITAQLLWIRSTHQSLEAVHNQIDFAQKTQLLVHQLATSISAPGGTTAQVETQINHLDHDLSVLKDGGRTSDGDAILIPLQRLPLITYQGLSRSWDQLKKVKADISNSEASESQRGQLRAGSLTLLNWFDTLLRDLSDELAKKEKVLSSSILLILILDVILLFTMVWKFDQKILRPLKRIETNTPTHVHTHGLPKNEIGDVALQVNEVIEQLRDASDYVKSISQGDLTKDYKELDPNYSPGKNSLADSLIAMQAKLRDMHEEEQKRQWANEGITKFVDILRSSSNDLHTLGNKIISTLVQYTGASQGGLYVLNEDDVQHKHLELISLFAFNSKKFASQKIKPGEGLLGQTFLEKATTYLTSVPDDYVRITSGLGDANPRAVLVVPLKVDDRVYGIVELASFKEFLPHEIAFVERLGESIASTLSSVKAAQNNKKLLEESRMTTEAMRSQEEEMRQNMEELTATQEEMHRVMKEAQQKESYLSNLMNATPDAFVAIDREYKVVLRNNAPLFDKFVSSGIPYHVGYYVLSLFKADEFAYHKSIYDKVFEGQSLSVTKEYFSCQYSVNYKPLRSPSGDVIGAAIYAHDLTEQLQLERELRDLKEQRGSGSVQTDDWAVTQLEKSLKFNLEALKITYEELKNKLS